MIGQKSLRTNGLAEGEGPMVLRAILSSSANAEIRAILIVDRRKLATDATQAAGGDETVLKLRSVTERKQSKTGVDDETDV
ncbi:hypothetical protein [Afipia sp. GAS231]|uniref:hypothetical protein n=1 Tax=Afipia sp. GAS231 TaxID=1882747 RepID=UPI000B851B7B|nr:hypothetical protein [Afipia sp. GAS231]